MSKNCFVRQEVNTEILQNIVKFCSECYNSISIEETIFYDMKSYRYLCERCKNNLEEQLNEDCEFISKDDNSLFRF